MTELEKLKLKRTNTPQDLSQTEIVILLASEWVDWPLVENAALEVSKMQEDNSALIAANIEVAELNARLQERIADLDEKVNANMARKALETIKAQEEELNYYRNLYPSSAKGFRMQKVYAS